MEAKTKVQVAGCLDNSGGGNGNGLPDRIRYPGVGMMFLVWSVVGVLTAARYHLPFGTSTSAREVLTGLFACTACYYPWVVLTPLVSRIERRLPLGTPPWPRHLALLAVISVPLCLLASPLMLAFFAGVQYAFGTPPVWLRNARVWPHEFPVAEAIFWCSVAGAYFIRTLFQLREQERMAARLALEKSQLEAGLNQAQIEVLRARLNPHFLFNSLQNISVLIKQDPPTASRMLTRLGDLLRAVLRQTAKPECTLEEEIGLTRTYVAMEQMRFGDRLHVGFAIAPDVQQAMVPCFLLQPLIENAIIHGLRGVLKTGIITVCAISREAHSSWR